MEYRCLAIPLLAILAPANAQVDESQAAVEEVVELDSSQEIRCRSRRVTGSNARRVRICMTNAEWQDTFNQGNADAREVYDAARRNACSSANCPN
jgi:hypothetical protein